MQWTPRNPRHGDLRRWLQSPGSLSARLAATGRRFSVQVLDQGRRPLRADEAQALGQPRQRIGYAREVVLRVDERAMVYARTVTRHADSLGAWRSLRGLGARPLADVLFTRAGIARAPLNYARLRRASPLQRHVARRWQAATGTDLSRRAPAARRSVFTRRGRQLLVMEVFAASAWDWHGAALSMHELQRRMA